MHSALGPGHTMNMKQLIEYRKRLKLEGCALLEEYTSLNHVLLEDEMRYLRALQSIAAALKDAYGGISYPIVHPSSMRYFQKLPNRVRIYRGYYDPAKKDGVSWSLSRKVAEGFAYNRDNERHLPPMVVTGHCAITKVVAYTNLRKEQEIVADPKNVKGIRNIKVRKKPRFPVAVEPFHFLLTKRQHTRADVCRPT